jgi:hypothetical protein
MYEPVMCPFCGGADLVEQEQTELETEDEYWVIYHWNCSDCGESFDKLLVRDSADVFEEMEDDDRIWS